MESILHRSCSSSRNHLNKVAGGSGGTCGDSAAQRAAAERAARKPAVSKTLRRPPQAGWNVVMPA